MFLFLSFRVDRRGPLFSMLGTSGAISTLFLIHDPLARFLPWREEEGRSPPIRLLSFVSSSPHESVPTSLMTYSGIHDDNRKLKALRLRPGRKTSMTTTDPHPVNQLWESNLVRVDRCRIFRVEKLGTQRTMGSCMCDVDIKIHNFQRNEIWGRLLALDPIARLIRHQLPRAAYNIRN